MIVEERIYTIKVGKLAEYLGYYESTGMPIQTSILPRMVGYFTTDVGPLSTVVHWWAYESYAEREEKRRVLSQHGEWKAYLKLIQPLILQQESRILVPTSFSPIR